MATGPKSEPTTAVRNRELVIDYSKLTVTEVDAVPSATRSNQLDKSPFLDWYKESQKSGKAKRFDVPSAAIEQVEYLVRAAARRLGGGVRFAAADHGNGKATVVFAYAPKKAATEDRKPRTVKRGKKETAADYNKRVAEYQAKLDAWQKRNPDKVSN